MFENALDITSLWVQWQLFHPLFLFVALAKKTHREVGVKPKKSCPSHKFFRIHFSVPQSFRLCVSWSSHNNAASNNKNTPKRLYLYIWDNYVLSAQTHYNFPTLSTWFANTCLSENAIAELFYFLWYNVIRWSSHVYKKFYVLSFNSLSFFSKWHKGTG